MLHKLVDIFELWSGEQLLSSQELTQAGSHRRYFRLASANKVVVGCHGCNVQENRAFFSLAQHFAAKQLPMPRVLATSECGEYYLQQDLGDTSLFRLIASGRETGRFSPDEIAALSAAIAVLPKIQYEGAQGLDYSRCYPQAELGRNAIAWDLSYFKYCFLKPCLENFDEAKLEADFERMVEYFTAEKNSCFMYRDFQSRNVMWHEGKPYFIDFQGGMKGAPHYDVASFLYQAKANFSDDLRKELLHVYLQSAMRYVEVNAADFEQKLPAYALLRTLQVLGAYGFRGYFERKLHFLQSVPFALKNLKCLLRQLPDGLDIPYLKSVLLRLVEQNQPTAPRQPEVLRVQIFSFSYRCGIPDDDSGNGGGFIFDCRSIFNPGRQEEFRLLTGLDAPVAQFLEANQEMSEFLQHACSMVEVAVERYLERGFGHLMAGFGCTGGQHRSVYAAQRLAERLHQKYPQIEIAVKHREQNVATVLKSAR
ncbi:MAG: phosphotransferase [Prevotellaceae bacterium]|jgi:aminoglycoside/choline kinase family phosphotransferase|nr:phosphotransferase [Prevotellaceae bacterium]